MMDTTLARPSTPKFNRWHRVLVVDDDPEVLGSIRRLLQNEAYDVVTADHPGLALEWLARRDVSLALVDLRMPEMSGFRFLDEVRKLHTGTALVLLTAYPEEAESGGVPVIRKPWDGERLKRTLRRLLADQEENGEVAEGGTA